METRMGPKTPIECRFWWSMQPDACSMWFPAGPTMQGWFVLYSILSKDNNMVYSQLGSIRDSVCDGRNRSLDRLRHKRPNLERTVGPLRIQPQVGDPLLITSGSGCRSHGHGRLPLCQPLAWVRLGRQRLFCPTSPRSRLDLLKDFNIRDAPEIHLFQKCQSESLFLHGWCPFVWVFFNSSHGIGGHWLGQARNWCEDLL